jgi:hypothetical protein
MLLRCTIFCSWLRECSTASAPSGVSRRAAAPPAPTPPAEATAASSAAEARKREKRMVGEARVGVCDERVLKRTCAHERDEDSEREREL